MRWKSGKMFHNVQLRLTDMVIKKILLQTISCLMIWSCIRCLHEHWSCTAFTLNPLVHETESYPPAAKADITKHRPINIALYDSNPWVKTLEFLFWIFKVAHHLLHFPQMIIRTRFFEVVVGSFVLRIKAWFFLSLIKRYHGQIFGHRWEMIWIGFHVSLDLLDFSSPIVLGDVWWSLDNNLSYERHW